MNSTKIENGIRLTPKHESIKEFLVNFTKRYSEFKAQHLVIDFSEKINTPIQDLLLLLNVSTIHRENGTSFVIICKGIDIDEIPDEMNVVPTFEEAVDILEMDAIERDLGF